MTLASASSCRLTNFAQTWIRKCLDNQNSCCPPSVLRSAAKDYFLLEIEPAYSVQGFYAHESDRALAIQDTRRDASQLLTRQGLLSDVTNKGLLNLVPEPINQLYTILEQDFSPLHLCQKLAPLLDQLESLDQPLSAASPVQNIGLLQYKKTLQQVKEIIN